MSGTPRSYTSVDPYPLTGTSYYRLAQHDFDGTITYSNTVVVNITNDIPSIHINPNSNTIVIKCPSVSEISICNIMGQLLWLEKGLEVEISTDRWPVGEYFVIVTTAGSTKVTMVTKSSSMVNVHPNSYQDDEKIGPIPVSSIPPETMSIKLHSQ